MNEMKIEKNIFSKVRKIHIKTSKMVTEVFSGEYRSVFKGKGMEFQEVREYQPGDDIRSIDWNVTAKMNRPFIKEFTEERELNIFFIVDVSSSMKFGSRTKSKQELVSELCAVLSFTAVQNNDKVGMLLFSDHVEKYIPLRKGKRHVLRVIREMLVMHNPLNIKRKKTDLSSALNFFNKMHLRKSVCFIVSDFFDVDLDKTLKMTSRKHDVIAIKIEDPLESEFPVSGLIGFCDLENGQDILVDLSSSLSVKMFKEKSESLRQKTLKQFQLMGIDCITLKTNEDYLKKINGFFKKREKRWKR